MEHRRGRKGHPFSEFYCQETHMSREKLIGLGRLNAYQIAGLSVVTSTVAALAVLFSVRRWFLHRADGVDETVLVEARRAADKRHAPDHFSENFLVQGITHTGTEILQEDGRKGHSSEGV
jgi:hypothetical protein